MPETVQTQSVAQDSTGTPVVQNPKPADTTTTETTKAEPSLLNQNTAESKDAPETYADFTLPEGYELDPKDAEAVTKLFKDANVSQTNAQKLIDFYVAKTQEAFNQPINYARKQQEDWQAELKADPEIGGKLDQVRVTVNKAIDGLGDSKLAMDFREAMDYTGAGNNPAFVRAFYKLAQKVTEGHYVAGRGPVEVQKDGGLRSRIGAHAMFPNLP